MQASVGAERWLPGLERLLWADACVGREVRASPEAIWSGGC